MTKLWTLCFIASVATATTTDHPVTGNGGLEAAPRVKKGSFEQFSGYLESFYLWEKTCTNYLAEKGTLKEGGSEHREQLDSQFREKDYSQLNIMKETLAFLARKAEGGEKFSSLSLPKAPIQFVPLDRWAPFLSAEIEKCQKKRDTDLHTCYALGSLLSRVVEVYEGSIASGYRDGATKNLRDQIFSVYKDMAWHSKKGNFSATSWIQARDYLALSAAFGDSRSFLAAEDIVSAFLKDPTAAPDNLPAAIAAIKNFRHGSADMMAKAGDLQKKIQKSHSIPEIYK